MVLDKIKSISDDSYFNGEHIIYFMNKYRAFLLKQRYSDVRKAIPKSNYQTVCLTLERHNTGVCGETLLKSKEKIPFLMEIIKPRLYILDYYDGDITYVSRDRMRYIGNNKYMKNIIYASIGPDNYLYLKSCNPQFKYLKNIKVSGIFENTVQASELQCDSDFECDLYNRVFPLEDSLIPPLIDLLVKEMLPASLLSEDNRNNAKDDLPDNNVKQ